MGARSSGRFATTQDLGFDILSRCGLDAISPVQCPRPTMFAVTVTFEIDPQYAKAFMPLMIDNAKASLNLEPACQQFDVCTSPTSPTRVFLYELYDDPAAFDVHLGMHHFKEFSAATAHMITDKTVHTFEQVTQ